MTPKFGWPEHAETVRDAFTAIEELHGAEIDRLDVNGEIVGDPLIAILPTGKRIENLKPIVDAWRKLPERRRGTSRVHDVPSLVGMALRFQNDESAIFALPLLADRPSPKFLVVFNYHDRGPNEAAADWCDHRCEYVPQLSDEWSAWMGKTGAWMAQADFAAFIEEHCTDVIVPHFDDPKLKTYADLVEGSWATPSAIVQLSRHLQVNVATEVRSASYLSTGEINVLYAERHTDGQGEPLRVPSLFLICIPVFRDGELYRIAARLRYRVQSGRVDWRYDLVRPSLAVDDAFKSVVETLHAGTNLPVFIGSPES